MSDNFPILNSQVPNLSYWTAIELAQFKAGFLARSSHELRSPLNGLISSLQLILADLCESPEEEREYVQIAHDSALKIVDLMDQVIQVSKLAYGSWTPKPEAIDLDLLLQELQYLLSIPAANRNVRLDLTSQDEDLTLYSDPDALRQALLLLLDSELSRLEGGRLSVKVWADDGATYLQLKSDRLATHWQETIDILTHLPQLPTDPQLTPDFRLMLAQELIQLLGGKLELLEVEGSYQLQCIFPRDSVILHQ
ncbi:MAG: histidine kinase dimerization/phospho-acceptor domain-containing protein [Synechococcales bacterium]|nr:histidine kinase dimerization/phospho-acceptor domain-containing protein [Synechococcales bacterium]